FVVQCPYPWRDEVGVDLRLLVGVDLYSHDDSPFSRGLGYLSVSRMCVLDRAVPALDLDSEADREELLAVVRADTVDVLHCLLDLYSVLFGQILADLEHEGVMHLQQQPAVLAVQ